MPTLIDASVARNDKFTENLRSEKSVTIHVDCRKAYTRKSLISAFKRQRENEEASTSKVSPPRTRARVSESSVCFKENCLFCGDEADEAAEKKKSQNLRKKNYKVSTPYFKESLLKLAKDRSDDVSKAVITRAGAAKIKEYHLNKQLQFLKKVSQNATDSSLCVAEGDIENEITALPRYKSQPRKRKADDKDDIEEDLLAILKTPENRHLHFFKGILPSLQSLNENQTLIFQSRVLQILTDILQPSIHQNTHHGYNQEYQHQGYNQGYSTMRYDNTVQSGYHTSTPGSSITEQRTTSSSNQQRPINSPFLLDETSATSYVSQDEEFDFS
ncbi:unnamed protein product [Parnassius apollo]|uniref:(apollo) hypothetical protein n=1 Tax=Parnassius apollo TaxID=110799 RepID=A0A8S3WPB9_PARAO|nr:unnamed protein product [Parnassius apollo]